MHIMHGEVTKTIRGNNLDRVREIQDKVLDGASLIRDNIEKNKKQDEALLVVVYARKGNDVIVSSHSVNSISTSLTGMDVCTAKVVIEEHLDGIINS